MNELRPKLFDVMKGYTKEQLIKDILSGIIVAIIALPLSIALALASGVTPGKGIYTAITAGFVISFLGGSQVQIAGPTAAFATIVAGIVARSGVEGLAVATILAGIILDKMGVRFTGMLSASLMFIGACIKYYGVIDAFIGTGAVAWLNSWWVSFPASAKLASLGFMI